MILHEENGVRWLEFFQLKNYSALIHGVFLSDESLEEKVTLFCKARGIESKVSAKQVHGDAVKHAADLIIDPCCDGIYATTPSQALFIRHADCQAALFYDPKQNVIANVHCGWRGNVQNIYAKTVKTLAEQCGSQPEDLIVCISPSLGPERSEFVNYKEELPEEFLPFSYRPSFFDLWRVSKDQLEKVGVLPSHIEIAGVCTYDNPDKFYSYRRDKTAKRNITMIALKR